MSTPINLSGTWIGNQGSEVTLTHHGNTIKGINWGGPANPDLRGSCQLSGGPTEYHGTYKNQKGEYHGSGTITFQVISKDVVWASAEGTVTYRGTQTPWSDSGNMRRK